MKAATLHPKTFRPWVENAERIKYAEKLGLSLNEVLNELMKDHMRDYLAKKQKKLREALADPIP